MAEPYLSQLRAIVARPGRSGNRADGIACKHFFSGAAAYRDGRVFMTLTPLGIALKLPEDDRAALLQQGARPLQYFPNAPVKKDYVLLPPRLSDDHDVLNDWISRSIEFVLK